MLYDSNSDKVMLEKEIEYLESFIELNALRIKEGRFVEFDVGGDIQDKMIPPMLLVPFVENAFKHGRKNYKLPGITLQMMVAGNRLNFDIRNYLPARSSINKDQQGGIGLGNVKKRLDMIYPGGYSLDIEQNEDEFHVRLIIQQL